MAKAMLIMEMPETCSDCCVCDEYGYCGAKHKLCASRFTKVQEWCPLREVPQKPDYPPINENSYVAGYNACIDEILGGGE